ncbi:MAG: tRNA dihydrouridine(20/20a) synthase DusA [Pseudomonadota bacterium]
MANDTKKLEALSVAPMMDWTDRHCRYFHRLLTPSARLYTEMVTTGAVIHGDRQKLLAFDPAEHPVALQLGGSDPQALAESASIGEAFGYDEINLNVGCPSDRVQTGRFGACLMREPALVADCLGAMREAVTVPVTVKHRLGVDEQDQDTDLERFVESVVSSGTTTLIVHARQALLKGLSPKENRTVPPLNYRRVYRLAAEHPELTIVINGGIETLEQCEQHLASVDGVMLGRAAYQNPFLLAVCEEKLLGGRPPASREAVLRSLRPYVERQLANGTPLKHMTRHILGLFQGQPGGRYWRRFLSENAHRADAGWWVVEGALEAVHQAAGKAA